MVLTREEKRGVWVRVGYIAMCLVYSGIKALEHDKSLLDAGLSLLGAAPRAGILAIPLMLGAMVGFILADRRWAAVLGAVCLLFYLALGSLMSSLGGT